jgi:site-specific DNA-methyltransferase (adenine-specific)
MSFNHGLWESNTDMWATPQAFFDKLHQEFNFTLDPCATHENAKCDRYYTKEDDGLSKDWNGETVFCNPPYGREIAPWVQKCLTTKGVRVALLPARTDTRWFHDYIYGKAEIRFVKGRLKFGDSKNAAPFPSMVVIWRD